MEIATKQRKKLLNRVRRIKGQIESIERVLSQGLEDDTTLQTLSACRGAIAGLMSEILEEHVRSRLLDPARDPADQARVSQEILELFRTYTK